MIWIAISLIICTILICCTIVLLNLSDRAYSNAISCLQDLCDTLNDKFPGSDLKVVSDEHGVKVEGELKYLTRNGD